MPLDARLKRGRHRRTRTRRPSRDSGAEGTPYDDDDDLGNRSPETVTDFRVVVNYVPEMPPP